MTSEIRNVNIIRYIQPFREGGSLPGLVSADDGFDYVIKFRGAGQGKKALVAEFIGGEFARLMKLRVPEMVFAYLDEGFGRIEPDEEIQDLLKFSVGENLGVSFLNGAITFDLNADSVTLEEASKIVWLDAYLMNVDRTVKNTNMLVWKNELWLIDHGAALYFHHNWDNWQETMNKPFIQIKDHVLLKKATIVKEIDAEYKKVFTPSQINHILNLIPDEWLIDEFRELSADQVRGVYLEFLLSRVQNSRIFLNQIQHAQETIV